MKIVVDRAVPFIRGVFEEYAEVVYLDGAGISRADVADADALVVRTRTRCGAALLEGSRVRLVATATIGFDHIDVEWCARHGIEVATSAGCNARGVLQWVAAVLARLAEVRRFSPCGMTLGVVGVGNVGSLVAGYARAWGFRVLCCDPPREEREHAGFLPLEQVLAESDIVTLHVPLDGVTRHMIGEREVAAMKRGAVLINASRGEVASTRALLDSGLCLALDVWEDEPEVDRGLLRRAEIATTHIAGYSAEGKATATAMAVDAVARRFGLPLRGWYPAGVERSRPREIGWERMCGSIAAYCDVAAETLRFKQNPDLFEEIRNGYLYRKEYF